MSSAKLQMDRRSLETKVGTVVSNLMETAEALQAISIDLETKGELNQRADSDEIKVVATSIRALALHALSVSAGAIGLSERLATLGSVLDLAESEVSP